MGLLSILGTQSWDYACKWLGTNYINNARESERRSLAAERDAFYEGSGDEYMRSYVRKSFGHAMVAKLRLDLIPEAKWNAVVRRFVRETATVYSETPRRTVGGSDDESYQRFLELVCQDDSLRELDRKLELHEDVWVQYRVRTTPTGKQPVIDLVSPSKFWAIASPADPTLLIGVILDQTPGHVGAHETDPHYRVWLNDETFQLDKAGRFITGSYETWTLGQMPGLLATTRLPQLKGCLLAQTPSADSVAAEKSVWIQGIGLLKESKSQTHQVYLTGDTTGATTAQPSDSEFETILPGGVSVQAVDRRVDQSSYRANADHVMDTAGANRGLPPSLRRHDQADSGAAYESRMIPLRQLRKERIPTLRRIERALAAIQAMVNAADLPEYGFDAETWAIDFGEIEQPLTPQERDAVYRERLSLGLTDEIEEERRRNPDIKTDEEAAERIAMRIKRQTATLALKQELAAMNGSATTPVGSPTAAQNGSAGGTISQADGPVAVTVVKGDAPPTLPEGEAPQEVTGQDQTAAPKPGASDSTASAPAELPPVGTITAVVSIAQAVSAGGISREGAIEIIMFAAGVDAARAARMLGPASFKPAVPEADKPATPTDPAD